MIDEHVAFNDDMHHSDGSGYGNGDEGGYGLAICAWPASGRGCGDGYGYGLNEDEGCIYGNAGYLRGDGSNGGYGEAWDGRDGIGCHLDGTNGGGMTRIDDEAGRRIGCVADYDIRLLLPFDVVRIGCSLHTVAEWQASWATLHRRRLPRACVSQEQVDEWVSVARRAISEASQQGEV